MKFDDVKVGTTFYARANGENWRKYWFVYHRDNDSLYAILFKSDSTKGRVLKIEITREIWNNPTYEWEKRSTTIDTLVLVKHKKKLIPAIFDL